ncbi:MAG: hypothetical protein HFI90_06970 [Clostridia bacterium]|nr:hypothetical protein [Clostridia bacterium]
MDKIILDLCGGTGSWSKPYKDAGYDVKLITLPKYDLFDTHTHTRIIEFRNNFTEEIEAVNADKVYGILAAPTCTMFSLARTTAKTPRDFESGMKLVKKCLEIIWFCRTSNDSALKFWALENPQGYLRQFLGRPPFTFSPEEYGENYTKKTDIWGYFNNPKKSPYKLSRDDKLRTHINNRVLPELPDDYIMPKGWSRQAAKRSMTSKRFAEAFFKANK